MYCIGGIEGERDLAGLCWLVWLCVKQHAHRWRRERWSALVERLFGDTRYVLVHDFGDFNVSTVLIAKIYCTFARFRYFATYLGPI